MNSFSSAIRLGVRFWWDLTTLQRCSDPVRYTRGQFGEVPLCMDAVGFISILQQDWEQCNAYFMVYKISISRNAKGGGTGGWDKC